ncbi:MAG: DUF420 domain-containing protein [Anaerolineae bacterium]
MPSNVGQKCVQSKYDRRHRRIARLTLPTWLYVAITGWIVYWMLYHMA